MLSIVVVVLVVAPYTGAGSPRATVLQVGFV